MADTLDLGSWFILRMANADTVKAYKALRFAGFNVWTPIEKKVRRTPRKRVPYDSEAALLPSYVFAKVEHLSEILNLALQPNRDIPRFSVFHHREGVPLIADGELAALRTEEARIIGIFERLKLKGRKGPKLSRGDSVRMLEGPLMGLSGVVEGQQGQYTLVSVDGFHDPIKISSILLLDEATTQQAKAA